MDAVAWNQGDPLCNGSHIDKQPNTLLSTLFINKSKLISRFEWPIWKKLMNSLDPGETINILSLAIYQWYSECKNNIGYSENNSVCKQFLCDVIFVMAFLWCSNSCIIIMMLCDLYKIANQILDSHKEDRWKNCTQSSWLLVSIIGSIFEISKQNLRETSCFAKFYRPTLTQKRQTAT